MTTVVLTVPYWLKPASSAMAVVNTGISLTAGAPVLLTSSDLTVATVQICLDGKGFMINTLDGPVDTPGSTVRSTTIQYTDMQPITYTLTLNVSVERPDGNIDALPYANSSRAVM